MDHQGGLAEWQARIEIDPAILVGKAVIRGTRLALEFLLDLMAEGWTDAEILDNYPELTADDLRAAIDIVASFEVRTQSNWRSRLYQRFGR